MPVIRNSFLIKRFTDFFKLKTNDFLDSEAGRMLVPVITEPIPKNVIQILNVEANDSNKTFTVPSGKQWKLLYGHINFIATATVGNRRIEFVVRDEGVNNLYRVRSLNVQIESTTEFYNLGNFGNVSESVPNVHLMPIPNELILPENFTITIFDVNDIDAAADDMNVRLIIEEIDVTGE